MKRQVLLVDDESNILRALERMLKRHGYDTISALGGAEGLEILRQQDCPVILSDFRMPEMNGAEFLTKARQISPHSVAMILSGYADFNSVLEVLNSGIAFKFLQKPWAEAQLLEDLEHAFAKYNEQRFYEQRTQLLISSIEPLLEIRPNGVITRANAAAQQSLSRTEAQLCQHSLVEFFPDIPQNAIEAMCRGDSFSTDGHTSEHVAYDLVVQRLDPHNLLIRLESVAPNATTTDQFSDRREVLDQRQLLNLIDHQLSLGCTRQAVVYLEIQHFCDLHSSIGFHAVDELVAATGQLLLEHSRGRCQLAYLFADQFVLLFEHTGHEANLLEQLQFVMAPFQAPLRILEHAVQVRFNVGYTLAPEDGNDAKTLIHQARQAARTTETRPHGYVMRFDHSFVESRRQQYEISNALYEAINQEQLKLVYQPKLPTNCSQCLQAEVLLRWEHPTLGAIGPCLFIPIAERDGQVHELGWWVIRQVLNQLKVWKHDQFFPQVAINISAMQLQNPKFLPKFHQLVNEAQIQPHQLQLELTESCLLANIEQAVQQLQQIRSAGFQIAIDDFGVGYSSLAYLTRLPVDFIKLDRSLISELESSLGAQSMIRHMIRMSHELDIAVVAEGVETPEQLAHLGRMQCDLVQGYLCARPLTAEAFQRFCHSLQQTQSDGVTHG